jgi:hypothetical protein
MKIIFIYVMVKLFTSYQYQKTYWFLFFPVSLSLTTAFTSNFVADFLLRAGENERVLSYLEPVPGATSPAGHSWCGRNRLAFFIVGKPHTKTSPVSGACAWRYKPCWSFWVCPQQVSTLHR